MVPKLKSPKAPKIGSAFFLTKHGPFLILNIFLSEWDPTKGTKN